MTMTHIFELAEFFNSLELYLGYGLKVAGVSAVILGTLSTVTIEVSKRIKSK